MRNGAGEQLRVRFPLLLVVACGVAITSPIVFGLGYPAPQARDTFEVASIRSKQFQPGMSGIELLPGGVRGTQAPILYMIVEAYELSSLRQLDFEKADKSVLGSVYDFEAKAGANALPENAPAPARKQQLRRMLQTLLAERFKLVLHKEQRELPIYALVVAPNGPKFSVSQSELKCPQERPEDPWFARFGPSCGVVSGGPTSGLKGLNIEMTKLVERLDQFGDRRIVDQTGIKGRFDFQLPPWNRSAQFIEPPEDGPSRDRVDSGSPSIFTVLQDKLGLRLVATRGATEVFVIDHIEGPTPN